jgi:hypothetical protein
MKTLCLVAAGLFVIPLAAQQKHIWDRSAPLPYGFNTGDVFPTQALPSAIDGKPTSVARFRGRKVIVNVFASW